VWDFKKYNICLFTNSIALGRDGDRQSARIGEVALTACLVAFPDELSRALAVLVIAKGFDRQWQQRRERAFMASKKKNAASRHYGWHVSFP